MRPDVRTLRRESRDRANRARATSRLVSGEAFEEAYAAASDADADALVLLLQADDRDGIEQWLKSRQANEVGAMTLRELRTLGQKLGVRSYNHLPKASLLSEIVNAQK